MTRERRLVVVDTDIGTDVDDALALTTLLGASEIDLCAITVAYADTRLRARIAGRICELAGRSDVPIARGAPEPVTDDLDVFWLGHEGAGLDGLDDVPESLSVPAEQLLRDLVVERPGQIDVLCLAPLGNLARAIALDGFAASVRHLWIMGGDFLGVLPEPEHNWRCDPVAADTVLRSGIPMTICGIDQTLRTHLGRSAALVLESRGELGRVLAGLMRRWWDATAPDTEDFPHDAVTALLLLHPELFTFREVTLALETAGAAAGRVVAHDDPGSTTRIVSDLRVAAVERRVLEYMLAAIPEDQACGRNPV